MKNSEILAEFPKIHPVYRGDLDGRSVHFEDADVDDPFILRTPTSTIGN